MTTPDDNIEYDPTISDIVPTIGSNIAPPQTAIPSGDGIAVTYASVPYLRSLLEALLDSLRFVETDIETDLSKFSLVITDSLDDNVLRQANDVEWPTELGIARNIVTYRYYKMLGIKSTKSAAYIRQRYEAAVRDVTGTSGIDLLALIAIMRNEAFLIQNFLDNHIGNMDDSSEYRAAELLQDWAESASVWTATIQQTVDNEGRGSASLPADEVEGTTPEDARKAQALFKVKMNALNDELARNLESFNKDFTQYADLFYNKFLGPGLTFRLNVSRNVYPTSGILGKEMYTAAGALDTNFTSQLTDMLRRNRIFDTHMSEVIGLVDMRDSYRGYIHQLAGTGQDISRGAQGTTVDEKDTLDEFALFKSLLDNAGTSSSAQVNVFQSVHDTLDGREADTAHPQYMLKAGDSISGDISVHDFKTVDGVDINLHAHSGADGSALISGENILPGTISFPSINTGVKPPRPERLRVQSEAIRSVPPGLNILDVTLAWDVDNTAAGNLTYEINIAPI